MHKFEIIVPKPHITNHVLCPLGYYISISIFISTKSDHNLLPSSSPFLIHSFIQLTIQAWNNIEYWLCASLYSMLLGPSALPTLLKKKTLCIFPSFPYPIPPYLSHQQVLFILFLINPKYANLSASPGLSLCSRLSSASSS